MAEVTLSRRTQAEQSRVAGFAGIQTHWKQLNSCESSYAQRSSIAKRRQKEIPSAAFAAGAIEFAGVAPKLFASFATTTDNCDCPTYLASTACA